MSMDVAGRRRGAMILSVVSVLLALSGNIRNSHASSLIEQTQLDGTDCVPKYAVSLPVFGPAGSVPRVDAALRRNLTVTMKEIEQTVLPRSSAATCKLKLKFGKTRVWAYETTDSNTGEVLGPANWPAVTIVTRRGIATRVKYVNQLPSFNPSHKFGPGLVQGLLPFDQTIHWADPLQSMGHAMERAAGPVGSDSSSTSEPYIGPIPATVHLHGAEIPAIFDGNPDSWFTPGGLRGPGYHTIGRPGPGEAIYEYANSQEAGTLWFHDHTLGTTRINVYAGLAGFYFLEDPSREPKGYPSGPYEIEMALQDRSFDQTGQLYFQRQQATVNHPFWSVLFEGDVATVNGAAFPYLNVEPRRYRFHLLNGSNHRGFTLVFGEGQTHPAVYFVGSDDNYFDKPVPAKVFDGVQNVPLSPGERTDMIVDFSNFAGQTITLANTAGGMQYDLKDIMQFRVASRSRTPETSCDPARPVAAIGLCARKDPFVRLTDGKGNMLPEVKIDKVRQLTFYDYVNKDPGHDPIDIKEYVNNTVWNGLESPGIAHDFPSDGVSELPREGSIELWEIAFLSANGMASHPFHIHLAQFQVLNRQQMYIDDDPITGHAGYLPAWEASFGKDHPELLLPGCSVGTYCADFGPPLDYKKLNKDGALGGNPAFAPYLMHKPEDTTPPEPGETGWKDTAEIGSGQVLRILVRWTPSDVPTIPYRSYAGRNFYEFDPTQGAYVWHCHILNHEDNEMMRPYRVTK